MTKTRFEKLGLLFVIAVTVFEIGYLLWQHFNGGIVRHYLLHSDELPSISNAWGIVILPVLAWFTTRSVQNRVFTQPELATPAATSGVDTEIVRGVLIGFFGMLLASLALSAAFMVGHESITMYTALAVLIVGLFLPIYRPECVLGYLLGAVLTFGPVIPLIGMLLMGSISAVANLLIKPALIRTLAYFKRSEAQ